MTWRRVAGSFCARNGTDAAQAVSAAMRKRRRRPENAVMARNGSPLPKEHRAAARSSVLPVSAWVYLSRADRFAAAPGVVAPISWPRPSGVRRGGVGPCWHRVARSRQRWKARRGHHRLHRQLQRTDPPAPAIRPSIAGETLRRGSRDSADPAAGHKDARARKHAGGHGEIRRLRSRAAHGPWPAHRGG